MPKQTTGREEVSRMSPTSQALSTVTVTGRARGGVRVYAPATGKGSYRVVWTDQDGRQRERTRTDLTQAQTLARQIAEQLALEVPPTPPAPGTVTFGDALAHVLTGEGADPAWAASTVYRYRDAARRAIRQEDLGVPMSEILTDPTHAALRRILDRAAGLGCTPGGSEYYQVGSMLSAIIRRADQTGLVVLPPAGNPVRALDYRRTSGPGVSARARASRGVTYIQEQDRPTQERVDALVCAADTHLGEQAGTALAAIAYGGPRLGELLALRAAQLLDPDVLRVGGVFIDRQLIEYRNHDGPGGD